MSQEPKDAINPDYYRGQIECIEVIEQLGMGEQFCRATTIKYLWRVGRKDDELQDLKKAQWYLERLIKQVEERRKNETDI